MANRFFISGCHRSGTTMLRLILDAHSKIYCYDERTSYAKLARGLVKDPPPEKTFIGYKIPRWAEQFDADLARDYDTWGVPDSGCSPFYKKGEPIIFMVRDPRDCIVSMLKLNLLGRAPWLLEWGIPMLQFHLRHDPDFGKKWQAEIEAATSSRLVTAWGALFWAYKTECAIRYSRKGFPLLLVSYEGLVKHPSHWIKEVIEHIGVEWEDNVLQHHYQAHTQLEENGLAIGHTSPKRQIDEASVGQWRTHLSPWELGVIEHIVTPTLDKLRSVWSAAPDLR